jgi:hypothetical protein
MIRQQVIIIIVLILLKIKKCKDQKNEEEKTKNYLKILKKFAEIQIQYNYYNNICYKIISK